MLERLTTARERVLIPTSMALESIARPGDEGLSCPLQRHISRTVEAGGLGARSHSGMCSMLSFRPSKWPCNETLGGDLFEDVGSSKGRLFQGLGAVPKGSWNGIELPVPGKCDEDRADLNLAQKACTNSKANLVSDVGSHERLQAASPYETQRDR